MKQYGRVLPKDLKALIDLAIEQDWTYAKTTSGHHRLVNPRGQIVIGSGTTGDSNSIWDFRARLKKAGLKPAKGKSKRKEEKQHVTTENVPPQEPVVASTETKKTRKTMAGVRGGVMKDAIMEALRKNDRPEGMRVTEISDYVRFKLGKDVTNHTVASSVRYYSEPKYGGQIIRVGFGLYRLAEAYRMPTAPTPTEVPKLPAQDAVVASLTTPEKPSEEDDDKELAKAMDAIVDALATIDRIVKRTSGARKKLRDILGEI